ncbi:TPA: hypothetical protein N0F65_004696 [Lagenidium giganteum]|uniref:Peptidase A2 domain-containing protein n=1 Tax=Lagenidium giganteum TaxID=4803 RepID=A0AAV2Z0E4_9STRA|nr:TPA: hypothetical protein N0F65_004696 [Lagenidium giganteum]
MQQRFHEDNTPSKLKPLPAKPFKGDSQGKPVKSDTRGGGGRRNDDGGRGGGGAPPKRPPPRDGCLVCGGPHWLRDCPSATDEQKKAAMDRVKALKSKAVRVKSGSDRPGDEMVTMNDMLSIAYLADSGADRCMVPRSVVKELVSLDPTLTISALSPLITAILADGNTRTCDGEVVLDLKLVTMAGVVRVPGVPCLVWDAVDEELLLGSDVMCSLGIDVLRMIEQLASSPMLDEEADEFPVGDLQPTEAKPTTTDDDMVNRAADSGFPSSYLEELRATVMDYRDVWRTHLHADLSPTWSQCA